MNKKKAGILMCTHFNCDHRHGNDCCFQCQKIGTCKNPCYNSPLKCGLAKEVAMLDLKPCPQCGEVPEIGYACGEYFILSISRAVGACVCSSFAEMHSTKEQEIEAWNKFCKAERNLL